jgi:hypothetical protein
MRNEHFIYVKNAGGAWITSPHPSRMVVRGHRATLIVHGYNNDPEDAGKSYSAFYVELGGLLHSHQVDHLWEVYWPGYVPIKSRKIQTAVTAPTYSYQVLKAPDVGKALADHILAAPDLREVQFIAHSLGCRVVLETLKHLRNAAALGHQISITAICLMAAAVPVSSVDSGAPLEGAAKFAAKHYILYSPADHVLKWYFRPGQFLAIGNRWSQAIGRFGKPESCWTNRWENVLNTGLDHGEYYTGRPILSVFSPSRTAPTFARMFGYALPRYLLEHDTYIVSWPEPSSSILREHTSAE